MVDGYCHEKEAGRVLDGKICTLALDLPLTSYIYLHMESNVFAAIVCVFQMTGLLQCTFPFPIFENDLDLHLENIPSPKPLPTLPSDGPTPLLPLVTAMAPGGHMLQVVMLVMLRLLSGNTGETPGSRLVSVA